MGEINVNDLAPAKRGPDQAHTDEEIVRAVKEHGSPAKAAPHLKVGKRRVQQVMQRLREMCAPVNLDPTK